ncbi:MAG: hypothetical protein Q9208_006215 [Pyrenodesmia sp. 3 TL-2023]
MSLFKQTRGMLAAPSEPVSAIIDCERYSILNSGRGADMTIICEGTSLRCHSAMVCPRSSFFDAAIWGNFQEGQTKTVHLQTVKLSMVRRMIRWFYLFGYNDQDEVTMSDVEVNAQMYAMADQFGVPGLKKTAARKFLHRCQFSASGWDAPFPVDGDLIILLDCVDTVYTSTPETDDTLRKHLTEAIVKILRSTPDLVKMPQFKEKCLQSPDLAYGIVKAEIEMTSAQANAGWGRPSTRNWSTAAPWDVDVD